MPGAQPGATGVTPLSPLLPDAVAVLSLPLDARRDGGEKRRRRRFSVPRHKGSSLRAALGTEP